MPLTAEDRSEIMMLAGRYSQSLDLSDPEAWRAVWTDDGVMEMELQERWITGDSLWALPGNRDPEAPVGRHQPSTFVIDGDGEAATMSSYVTVVRASGRHNPFGDPARIVFQGRYEDRLQRVDGVWKIAHRKIITDWIDSDTNRNVSAANQDSAVSEAAS